MKPGWRVSHEPLQKNTKHIDVHNLECFNEVMTIPSNNGWGNDFASFIGRWQPKGTKNKTI